jgi:AcrR family transcriptional regulator
LPGRRELRQQRTFAAILSAADRFFHEPGYQSTTIEMIAAEAGVAPGTVYNYFGTKSAILTAVVARQSEDAISMASTMLDLTASDPVEALMPVVEVYMDVTLGLGADLLRELFRAFLDTSEALVTEEIWSIDERAIEQIAGALSQMQFAGALADDTNPADVALVVYSLIATAVMMFMSVPGTTPTDVKATIRQQLKLVFAGIGPR